MELKVFKDTLSTTAKLCECKNELPIDAEILVPDYLPQVFKIIKCFVYLVNLQKRVSAGRMSVEGYLRCVVYYQAEGDQSLCQTEQKIPFTRSMDLPAQDSQGYLIQVYGEVEYLNCRAVNQRRIDLRGAYSLTAAVTIQQEQEIITALADCGIEQSLRSITSTRLLASLDKLFTAEEDLAFPEQPDAILDISGLGQVEDIKLISGKAVVKGQMLVSISYRTKPGCQLDSIQKAVPFHQILDLDSVPDDCICFAHAEMSGCTLMASSGQEGENTITATLILHLRVLRSSECYVVGDAFSTRYAAEINYHSIRAEYLYEKLDKTCELDVSGNLPDENAKIIGCFVTLGQPEWRQEEQSVRLCGRSAAHVLCLNSLGEIDCYDKAFEYGFPGVYPGSADQYRQECWPVVTEVSSRKEGNLMLVHMKIQATGLIFASSETTTVDTVICDTPLEEEEPDVALRIYYAQPEETIFNIAKRYHVSPAAMMKLNRLDQPVLENSTQLLVPMTV